MAELFSYINQLSPAGLLLHAAFLLFGLLVVFYLLPSKSKSSKRSSVLPFAKQKQKQQAH